jgi:hypothetical protein
MTEPYRSPRILGLALHSRYVGRVAIDGFGLVGEFGTWRMGDEEPSERLSVLSDALEALLQTVAPRAVAIVLPPQSGARTLQYYAAVKDVLARANIPVATRSTRVLNELFVGRACPRSATELAHVLARHFLPEVGRFAVGVAARERYRRAAFQALAGALYELALKHPEVASALHRQAPHLHENYQALVHQSL